MILRPYHVSDIPFLVDLAVIEDIRYLTGEFIDDSQKLKSNIHEVKDRLIQWYTSSLEDKCVAIYCIVDNDHIIGELSLEDIDYEIGSCTLKIMIHPAYQNKGFGKKDLMDAIEMLDNASWFHRLEIEVYSFNSKAKNLYQSLGFKLEGTKRDAFKYNGVYFDTLIYSYVVGDTILHLK